MTSVGTGFFALFFCALNHYFPNYIPQYIGSMSGLIVYLLKRVPQSNTCSELYHTFALIGNRVPIESKAWTALLHLE